MNVDFYGILEEFGSGPEALRALFTANPDGLTGAAMLGYEEALQDEKAAIPDGKRWSKLKEKTFRDKYVETLWDDRGRFERRIHNRVTEGRAWSLKNYRHYMVADMAMDAGMILPENIPLRLYAHGHINLDQCYKQLKSCKSVSDSDLEKMVVKDPSNPTVIKELNLPRLNEIVLNLCSSTVRRRVAAQSNKYTNLYPFFSYESRSKTMVNKLKAEVLSERVEVFVDQYGYRHGFTQALRKTFLHSHAVSYVDKAWEVERQHVKVTKPGDEEGDSDEDTRVMKEVIVKEGMKFVTPHPSRSFHDMAHSMSTINSDTGVRWCGWWDVKRFRDMRDNPAFWNLDKILHSESTHFKSSETYFNYYYPTTIKFPTPGRSYEEGNNRDTQQDIYTNDTKEDGIWVTNYFEKIIPKDVGIGGYPNPVWLRTVVASDRVVIFAEILPSRPACYMGYDEDDSKVINQGMVHEIIPYQDQATNLMSQALHLMKLQSVMILCVDKDQLNPTQRRHIKDIASSATYYSKTLYVEHSASKKMDIFQAPQSSRPAMSFIQAQGNTGKIISELLSNVLSIISLMEKNQMMSPQEVGQFSQRETTAQEVFEVSQTTNSLFGYISEGADEYRGAQKKIIHDSLLALGSEEDFSVYVQEKYPDDVITAAGFAPKKDNNPDGYKVREGERLDILGNTKKLAFEVVYNSRDGSERTQSTTAAKVLGDLTRYVLSTPEMFQAFINKFGNEQVTNMISEVFRLSGSGFILKVPSELESAEDALTQMLERVSQQLEETTAAGEENAAEVEDLRKTLETLAQTQGVIIARPAPSGGPSPSPAAATAVEPARPVEVEPVTEIPTVLQAEAT